MRACEGLRKVALGEDQTIAGWLEYVGALNEGRSLHKSDELFGEWLVTNNLSDTNQAERLAAMWAAANPAEFATAQVLNPKVRTVRGQAFRIGNENGFCSFITSIVTSAAIPGNHCCPQMLPGSSLTWTAYGIHLRE